MGRIKTQMIKRLTQELYEQHGDKLKDNFTENKTVVGQLIVNSSKKIRNVIAGYATRLVRNKKD